jgi:hypothetical protein
MGNKIWEFSDKGTQVKTAYQYLHEYASKLAEDTGGLIEGTVTQLISDSKEEVVYALYLVVPKLKNYSYRLIEVIQPNAFTFYPVSMKLFGTATGNIDERKDINPDKFEDELKRFIQSPLTKMILQHLKTQIEIKLQYE